jgi:hypothetical protein
MIEHNPNWTEWTEREKIIEFGICSNGDEVTKRVYFDGAIMWTLNNPDPSSNRMLHHTDEPALIDEKGSYWFFNGLLHNYTGPARIWKNGTLEFFIHGKKVDVDLREIAERHQLNPNWTEWTEGEKTIFRLALP